MGVSMAHILVVEDDVQFRQMLMEMLQQDGHQATPAGDGAEAMDLLARLRPDLIITDILMPNMDGVDLIMELSRQDGKVPVIAISGGRRSITAQFNLESASLLGVSATLAKPFSRADLRSAIAGALA
jgi:CheY-like chemotaxis protein